VATGHRKSAAARGVSVNSAMPDRDSGGIAQCAAVGPSDCVMCSEPGDGTPWHERGAANVSLYLASNMFQDIRLQANASAIALQANCALHTATPHTPCFSGR
jgi:hypothetical protein